MFTNDTSVDNEHARTNAGASANANANANANTNANTIKLTHPCVA